MRDRQRLSKFCLRHGRLLPTSAWTVIRRKWLGEQRFEHAAAQVTFDSYLHAVDLVDRRIEALERSIRETAEQGPWRELVARLRCLRGIDKVVRRLLVEAAWHARRRPKVGYELARRQRNQDAAVIERAWRCQQRLYRRWQGMAGRSKPHQKIVVACARELAGFVWAIATEQPLRSL
jgi:transposase